MPFNSKVALLGTGAAITSVSLAIPTKIAISRKEEINKLKEESNNLSKPDDTENNKEVETNLKKAKQEEQNLQNQIQNKREEWKNYQQVQQELDKWKRDEKDKDDKIKTLNEGIRENAELENKKYTWEETEERAKKLEVFFKWAHKICRSPEHKDHPDCKTILKVEVISS